MTSFPAPLGVLALGLPALALGGFLGSGLLMTGLWLRQRRTGNAAIVDVGWTVCIGLLGVAYAVLGHGHGTRRLVLGAMVGAWALRLAWHLIKRIRGEPEEGRYKALRDHWGVHAQARLFWFFLAQAAAAVLLALAFLPAYADGRAAPDAFDLAGLVLFVVAVAGESIADRQLAAFKADPSNSGGVCQTGLWAWSRHPNYFFEWLIWCAFVLPGLPSTYGALALLAPLTMLILVTRVTGIPTSEAQALRSRGDAYRAYQRSTSAFFPWPPQTEETA